MDHYRSRLGPDVVFLMASDEPSWLRKYLVPDSPNDTFLAADFKDAVVGKNRVHFDMAVLASCNHSIFRWVTSQGQRDVGTSIMPVSAVENLLFSSPDTLLRPPFC